MKKSFYLMTLMILMSASAFAETHTCMVKKSIAWLDKDGKYKTKFGVTKSFAVVLEEHETAYALSFWDEKEGAVWGEVFVSTGTLLNHSNRGDVVQAEAYIINEKGDTTARVHTVFGHDTRYTSSSTIIDLPNTDLDPILTIECSL